MTTKMAKEPLRVLVTGAAGQVAYSLIYSLSNGDVFGHDQPIYLHLLDIPSTMVVLEGVVMELIDCAFPLLTEIIPTPDEKVAFSDIDFAFLVGSMPRRSSMDRRSLLEGNVNIFKSQGKALDQYAKKDVKVLVVANPANTIAFICSKYAPSIPKENFSAMTRLDHNRALAQIALRLRINVSNVSNVIIWGNHSSTMYPDVSQAVVNQNGSTTSVSDAIKDDTYLQREFITTVAERGYEVIMARKMSSAMSAAKAAGDAMRDWFFGTPEDKIVSMAVYSDGSYDTPSDVFYSFPVTITDGKWKIVQGLELSEFSKEKLKITGEELVQEREDALSVST